MYQKGDICNVCFWIPCCSVHTYLPTRLLWSSGHFQKYFVELNSISLYCMWSWFSPFSMSFFYDCIYCIPNYHIYSALKLICYYSLICMWVYHIFLNLSSQNWLFIFFIIYYQNCNPFIILNNLYIWSYFGHNNITLL